MIINAIFKILNVFKKVLKFIPDIIITSINSLILIAIYILFVGLTSIIAKIIGKTFLQLHQKETTSYWIQKEKTSIKIEDYYKQY